MKLIKITIPRENQFEKESYPSEGFYENTETGEILVVSNKIGFPIFIAPSSEINHLFEADETPKNNISEDFVLKLVSLIATK